MFLETRRLAEEWTFRYLGAALAERLDVEARLPATRRVAEAPADGAGGSADDHRAADADGSATMDRVDGTDRS